MGLLSAIFGEKKMPTHLTDENFQKEVIDSDVPVIVDVWSAGCQPCKRLEEVMVSLASTYSGRVKVCEMNAAGAPKASMEFKIASTPTVLYFNSGELKERVVGFRSSLYHQEAIEELFSIPKKA